MRGIALGDNGGSSRIGVSVGAAALKISDSFRSACIWSLPSDGNGNAGDRCRSASVRNLAASAALLADDLLGMHMSCGKNSTVRAIRSALVFVT